MPKPYEITYSLKDSNKRISRTITEFPIRVAANNTFGGYFDAKNIEDLRFQLKKRGIVVHKIRKVSFPAPLPPLDGFSVDPSNLTRNHFVRGVSASSLSEFIRKWA